MARIRSIKPEFWASEALGTRLPGPEGRQARLLFIALWNHAEDHGVCRGAPALLRSVAFPYDEDVSAGDVSRWVGLLVEARMVVRYERDGSAYLWIRGFSEHQKIDRPSATTLPLPQEALDEQPDLAYPVLVRMKTPEERAQYDAEEEVRRKAARQDLERRAALKLETLKAKRARARVYFIQQDGGGRLVKIGTTTRPVEVRLKELQSGQAWPLVILAHAPGGRDQEAHLHRRFGPHNVAGEWFRPEADLLAYVATVGKGGVL